MTKLALVVVDLQEDFLPPDGSLAIKDGRSIVPDINKLLIDPKYKWSLVIATQDWHPANHISFASQHNVDPYTELTFRHPKGEIDPTTNEVKTMKQFVWPDHCVQNSKGASLEPTFEKSFGSVPTPLANVKKGYLEDREYYSCFQDCWGLHHTEILDLLKKDEITDVVFVGLAYDFCVLNSAIDCAKNGFNTFVFKQYTKSVYPDKEKDTDQLYTDNGVKIIEDVSQFVTNP